MIRINSAFQIRQGGQLSQEMHISPRDRRLIAPAFRRQAASGNAIDSYLKIFAAED